MSRRLRHGTIAVCEVVVHDLADAGERVVVVGDTGDQSLVGEILREHDGRSSEMDDRLHLVEGGAPDSRNMTNSPPCDCRQLQGLT
jgi:hypothetical protein